MMWKYLLVLAVFVISVHVDAGRHENERGFSRDGGRPGGERHELTDAENVARSQIHQACSVTDLSSGMNRKKECPKNSRCNEEVKVQVHIKEDTLELHQCYTTDTQQMVPANFSPSRGSRHEHVLRPPMNGDRDLPKEEETLRRPDGERSDYGRPPPPVKLGAGLDRSEYGRPPPPPKLGAGLDRSEYGRPPPPPILRAGLERSEYGRPPPPPKLRVDGEGSEHGQPPPPPKQRFGKPPPKDGRPLPHHGPPCRKPRRHHDWKNMTEEQKTLMRQVSGACKVVNKNMPEHVKNKSCPLNSQCMQGQQTEVVIRNKTLLLSQCRRTGSLGVFPALHHENDLVHEACKVVLNSSGNELVFRACPETSVCDGTYRAGIREGLLIVTMCWNSTQNRVERPQRIDIGEEREDGDVLGRPPPKAKGKEREHEGHGRPPPKAKGKEREHEGHGRPRPKAKGKEREHEGYGRPPPKAKGKEREHEGYGRPPPKDGQHPPHHGPPCGRPRHHGGRNHNMTEEQKALMRQVSGACRIVNKNVPEYVKNKNCPLNSQCMQGQQTEVVVKNETLLLSQCRRTGSMGVFPALHHENDLVPKACKIVLNGSGGSELVRRACPETSACDGIYRAEIHESRLIVTMCWNSIQSRVERPRINDIEDDDEDAENDDNDG